MAPGPKGMREPSEREHTLAGVSLDRFFTDLTQKAQIVLLDGLVMTAIAELADRAMIIQQKLRRAFGSQALGVFLKCAGPPPKPSASWKSGSLKARAAGGLLIVPFAQFIHQALQARCRSQRLGSQILL
jgi:hypothetical protein